MLDEGKLLKPWDTKKVSMLPIHIISAKEVTFVLSVCLSVCQQGYAKINRPIFQEICWSGIARANEEPITFLEIKCHFL